MKLSWLAALALVFFSLTPRARAQATIPLMTVDAVNLTSSSLSVTGIVQGDSEPSTRTASFLTLSGTTQTERCYRLLLLALSKPGQYLAKVGPETCTVALVAP
jgi:hypothetical protein